MATTDEVLPEVCGPALFACADKPCPDLGGCIVRGLIDGLAGDA